MAGLFGTNGVRGKFDFLTPELSMKIAKAIGVYFKRGRMVVARDGRLTGETLKNAINAGLMSVGCEVIDLDYCSAPTAEFMLKKLKADGLIIITASHNPPEWNAMKVVDGSGVAISKERGMKIESLLGKTVNVPWNKIGRCNRVTNAHDLHIEEIKKLVDVKKIKNKKLKLVLDCGNGMAGLIAPKLFEELGCKIILVNSTVDGRFPGRPSEPTESNVQELIKTVKNKKADAGIAWDGDGDRVIMIDESGDYLIGDKVFAISTILRLKKKKGLVVTTVATSKAIEDIAAGFGCKTEYTKIGAPYLSERVLEKNATIGGEEVGGVIWPEMSLAKDGFLTAAKITEALTEKSLGTWTKEIPIYYNQKTKIAVTSEQKNKVINGVIDFAEKNKLNVKKIDGIRIDFDYGWVIVRASGTENYIRIFAETKEKKNAKELIAQYEKIVTEII